jgi:uncharacterized protein YkwD
MRRTALALLVVSMLVATTPSLAAGKPVDPLVKKVNSVRERHDLPALRHSPSLSRSSGRFASHLMRTNQFAHASSIWASSRFSRLAEIIAYHSGTRAQRSRTVRRWMHSPGHRSAILDPRVTWVGAGRAVGRLWGRKRTIWAVQFGRL